MGDEDLLPCNVGESIFGAFGAKNAMCKCGKCENVQI